MTDAFTPERIAQLRNENSGRWVAGRNIRTIKVDGDVGIIPLSKGLDAIIDLSDVLMVCDRNWTAFGSRGLFYAACRPSINGVRTLCLLHRVLINAPNGLEVDHINGDSLDNRRSNLRLATREENQRNKSVRKDNPFGLKGVSLHSSSGKWQARITAGGGEIYLGLFPTPEMAHSAYAEAAIRLHGKFARTT